MIVFKKAADINEYLNQKVKEGIKTGFVPTMGALHEGHISLLDAATKSGALSVCSIFVNPTQFNDAKDFENYPSSIEKDIDQLEKAGCAVLFLPSVKEMYPDGLTNNMTYDLGYLETVLEGKYRPGHFQGVCQVVHRLLDIIPSTELYLGQKDYQQCMVLKKLVELKKLPIRIIICPTLRDPDGLAMSSRNLRLSVTNRSKATGIFNTLSFLKAAKKPGSLTLLKKEAVQRLTTAGFKVDYIEIADAGTLELLEDWNGKTKTVALCAAFLDDVRLIDNMLL